MPAAEYTRYKSLSPKDQQTYQLLLDVAQSDAFQTRRVEALRADWAAQDAVATANYEREAGAALMPIAIYALPIYKNSQAEFDKKLESYRSYNFYNLLWCACRIMGIDSKLTNREDGSPAAKAFRLKLAKDLAALWSRSKERATIKNKEGKTVEIFKLLGPTYESSQKG
jgi:hypothetical protein